jgi:CRISPR-associated protein Cas2
MLVSPHRTLYLIAYDVADPKRLARVHRYLLGWKVGGQKSFYECWLTRAELATVTRELGELIDPASDRVHIFQLDERMQPKCYGIARPAPAQSFILV